MAASEFAEKIDRVVGFLESEDLDAVMLNSQHNFAWITGGASNGIDVSREAGAASILVSRDRRAFLLANNIEMPRMLAEQVSGFGVEPVEFSWQSEKANAAAVRDAALRAVGKAGRIATDIPMFPDTPAVDGRLAPLRYQLTEDERRRFSDLGRDASDAMDATVRSISPGQSEIRIAEVLRQALAGRNIAPIVLLVAADERIALYRHPLPTSKCWKEALLVVTCAKRHGLIASLSRMISSGLPDENLTRRTEAAAFVNASLWHASRPGTSGAVLYRIAAEAYERAGFADEIDKHHQGGAAGFRTREWVAHPGSGEVVMANQAFAWNPSVTGTKIEETILVGDDGIEVLTSSNSFPTITRNIEDREYHSPGILNIN